MPNTPQPCGDGVTKGDTKKAPSRVARGIGHSDARTGRYLNAATLGESIGFWLCVFAAHGAGGPTWARKRPLYGFRNALLDHGCEASVNVRTPRDCLRRISADHTSPVPSSLLRLAPGELCQEWP
jgi:hypothetical protein